MAASDDIRDLMERYFRIDSEVKLLQEDKKNLLEEFKTKVSPKAFKAALSVARIQAKLKDSDQSDFDAALGILENELTVEQVA